MEREYKCPVCNKTNIETTYSGSWGLEESYYTCSQCGYTDEFAYGYSKVIVKGVCLLSSYLDDLNTIHLYNKRYKKLLYAAKRNWKKYKKSYFKITKVIM